MALVQRAKDYIAQLVNRAVGEERQLQVDEIKTISDGWKPRPHRGTFREDMNTRQAYFHGSMQGDMDIILKERYPQTYKEMQTDQVNFKVLRKKIKDKAKVFLKKGKLYLIDEEGNRVKDEQQDLFQELLETSRFFSNCKQADEYTQLCHRSLFKAWWDKTEKRVQISIWPPQLIHVAPDPERWWDINAAYAVLLELPGVDGINSMRPRYELWGYRDPEVAAVTKQQTVHYTTDGDNDYQANPEDVNPFTYEGRPIYPFVLWKDDETTDLFRIEEDTLTINRAVNCHATDTHAAMKYLAWPIVVYTQGEGGSDTLGVKKVGPGQIVDLSRDSTLELLSPDLNLGEHRQYMEATIRDDSMLDGLSSSTLRTEKAAPESGYKEKLNQRPLAEHRENNIEIYRPFVLGSAKRVVVVRNYYAKGEKIDLEKYSMVWEPGEMEIPENPEEVSNNQMLEISKNVSSSVEWRMKVTGEDRATAEKAVKQNQKDNEKYGGGEIPEAADNRVKTPPVKGEPEETEPVKPGEQPPAEQKPGEPKPTSPEGV